LPDCIAKSDSLDVPFEENLDACAHAIRN
jgi:hypothetical protein